MLFMFSKISAFQAALKFVFKYLQLKYVCACTCAANFKHSVKIPG